MLSVVIPVYNENRNLYYLHEDLTKHLQQIKKSYEIIFVDDGSIDDTEEIITALSANDTSHVKAIFLQTNYGKASALHAGFEMAKGDIIITMDGDMQDDPREIPRMIAKIEEGYDLVSGWKRSRKDSFIKNKTSLLFNFITNRFSKVKLHDYNCGFKAYRKRLAKRLQLYGELHRFIPLLAASGGYKVVEIPVHHRKRKLGKSKYGPLRFIHGFLDLWTIIFITRFTTRPMHLFGYLGLAVFGLGFSGGLYLTWVKFVDQQAIGDRPLLLLAIMLMVVGVQVGFIGILGEHLTLLVNRQHPQYHIRETISNI